MALRMLSELPQTFVAVISGRALGDLAKRTRDAGDIHLVGSHGSEFEPGFAPATEDARRLLAEIIEESNQIAERYPGAIIEVKPASLAFHYRNISPELAVDALHAIHNGPATRPGVHLRKGKKVVELSVVKTNKGVALGRLRQRVGATAVIFVGDDLTDEDAFVTLSAADLALKVGEEPTAAHHRVAATDHVAPLLVHLAQTRSSWLAGAEAIPIQDHAMLSDQRTVALIAPNGRIAWLCLPRIDSSAVFAEILGGPSAGFFEVRPAEQSSAVAQEYVGDSFVLRTIWADITVTDYLDASGGRAYQRAGRTDLIRTIEGRGRVEVTFAPRLDFGRLPTRLVPGPHGITVEGSVDAFVLFSPGIKWEIVEEGQNQTARATIELTGDPVVLDLRYGTANLEAASSDEPRRREQNQRFWQGWTAGLSLPRIATDEVRRSALVLKGLVYGPTGAIAAAATTSLPECAGGMRNWDYRFCWPRDAAISAHALVMLGFTGPALKFLDWIQGILEGSEPGSFVRPVYSVTGRHLGAEAEIPQLAGYRGSRPVRVGNSAAHQVQLDVFGPVADLIAALTLRGAPVTPEHWQLTERMVDAVSKHWREPDHGIWEVRLSRRHYVHSKVMCWLTVDRAIAIGKYVGFSRPQWHGLRDEIAADVLEKGWSESAGSFGSSYEELSPDAAVLWVGLGGLVPASDPRFVKTIEFVERTLRRGSTVFRYRFDDGLPGIEGGFNLCTSWLIEAYARVGRIEAAMELFEKYLQLAGPTGLIAEESAADNGHALGNYPQAYSHAGLIRAAMVLDGYRN